MKQAWNLTTAGAGPLQGLKPMLGYGFTGQNIRGIISLHGSLLPHRCLAGSPFCELRCDKRLWSRKRKIRWVFFKGGKKGLVSYSGFIPNLGHSMVIPSVILAQLEGLACWKCTVRSEQWAIWEQDWFKSVFVAASLLIFSSGTYKFGLFKKKKKKTKNRFPVKCGYLEFITAGLILTCCKHTASWVLVR